MIGCKKGSFGSRYWSNTRREIDGHRNGELHVLEATMKVLYVLLVLRRRVIASRPTQLHSSACYKDCKQCQRYCDQGWRRNHQSSVSLLNASVTAGYLDMMN